MRFKKRYLFIILAVGLYFGLSHAYVTPILMYHHVDDRSQEWKLSVSPKSFRRQMEFLKAHQYRVLSLQEYTDHLKENMPIPKKSVVITFDDGYENNFVNAFPVLKKLEFPATIFIQVDGINRRGYMTQEDISILLDNGLDIGSHTLHHAFLPELEPDELEKELVSSRYILENRFRRPITLFSYPGGGINEEVQQAVIDAGYEGAVATHPGPAYDLKDPYALRRIRISRTADNLFVFWLKISGFYTYLEDIRG